MKVLMISDLEGISGIVNEQLQALPSAPLYQEARKYMMSDINSAVTGLLEAGAEEVVVFDTHCEGLNIIIEELHERATAILGNPIIVSEELIKTFNAKILIGYHSMAETPNGLLCHTYPLQVQSIKVNGLKVGEIGMEMLVAAYLDIPTIMVTGDSKACGEAKDLIENIETVSVKTALGYRNALCDSLSTTKKTIKEAAKRAVKKYKSIELLKLDSPYRIEISFYEKKFARRVFQIGEHFQKELKDSTVAAENDNLYLLWAHLKDAIWKNL